MKFERAERQASYSFFPNIPGWADDGSWVPRTDAAADVRPPTWPAATLPPVATWADPVDGAAP